MIFLSHHRHLWYIHSRLCHKCLNDVDLTFWDLHVCGERGFSDLPGKAVINGEMSIVY